MTPIDTVDPHLRIRPDLLVYGQITRDLLYTSMHSIERIGGAAYASSTAARLGLRTVLLGTLIDPNVATIRTELSERGIDCHGLAVCTDRTMVFTIEDADELVAQRTDWVGPAPYDQPWPETVPETYQHARAALLYPVWAPAASTIARQLRDQGTFIAMDFQHDVASLADAESLINFCDLVFMNASTLQALTETDDIDSGLSILRSETGTQATVVIKMGLGGSMVSRPFEQTMPVPAFLSDFQFTVGAGDAYDAAFLQSILGSSDDLLAAGIFASRVAAAVVECTDRDPSSALSNGMHQESRQAVFLPPDRAQQLQVYVAGHFHSAPIRGLIEEIASVIEHLGMRTFLPHRDVGTVGQAGLSASAAYSTDMQALRQSHAVVALLDGGSHGGTFFEMGVAAERSIPIVALRTDATMPISAMVRGGCSDIVGNLRSIVNPLMGYLASFGGIA